VYDNGAIELGTYEGLYCYRCELYYTEDELVDGKCPIHGLPVERVSEENYFFKLSAFEDRLLAHYAEHPEAVQPEIRLNETLGLIRQGLRDFSMSRTSISWGIPLPWDPKHVAYVWFDALFNYCTAVGYGEDRARFDRYWPVDYHLIGKDIIRHHCVYWPAMLMSGGIEPPKGWAVGGWLLVGGEKMSKTTGNVVTPLELVDTVGVDGFRYYILADTPYGQDGDFTYEGLVGRYNADLANNLGNLMARVATVVGSKCGGLGPAPSSDSPLAAAAADAVSGASAAWDVVAPSRALEATWQLVRATNAHLEAHEPWKLEPGPEVEAVLGDALEALRIITILASPAVPATAQAIWERIGLAGAVTDRRVPADVAWGGYPGGLPVVKGPSLFPRITA
jgi:methionyl-tRNA synthetase